MFGIDIVVLPSSELVSAPWFHLVPQSLRGHEQAIKRPGHHTMTCQTIRHCSAVIACRCSHWQISFNVITQEEEEEGEEEEEEQQE